MNWVNLGIVGLGLSFLGAYGLSRLTGAIVRRFDCSAQRTKVLAVYSRLAVMGVSIVPPVVLYVRFQFLEPVVLAVESAIGFAFVRYLLHGLGMGIVALGAVYAVHRGLTPTVKAVLAQRHTVEPHRRRRLWFAHSMLIVGYPALGLAMIGAGVEGVWITGITIALVLGWLILRNPLVSFAYRTRDPTSAERTRLEACFDRFERRPPKVVIFDDPDEDLDVRLDGRGDGRCLWLNESVLSAADDGELAALLAQEAEKNRRYYYEYGRLSIAAVIVAGAAALIGLDEVLSLGAFGWDADRSWFVVVSAGSAVFLGSNWSMRRCIRRADDAICTRLDPDLVRRAYDRFPTAISMVDQDALNAVSRRLAADIPVERRIRRIERDHSLEAPEGDHDTPDSHDRPTRDGGLVALDPAAFADLVADLRAAWGRECTVADSAGEPWIDVRARADDGTRELLRTVHCTGPEPVTRGDIGAGEGWPARSDADSVVVVTNGQFAGSVRALETEADVTLVDGPRLVELLEEADLTDGRSPAAVDRS